MHIYDIIVNGKHACLVLEVTKGWFILVERNCETNFYRMCIKCGNRFMFMFG